MSFPEHFLYISRIYIKLILARYNKIIDISGVRQGTILGIVPYFIYAEEMFSHLL